MTNSSAVPLTIKLLALSVVVIIVGYASAFVPAFRGMGAWVMAIGVALNAVAALALGALRHGDPGPRRATKLIVATLVGTGAVLIVGFAIALLRSEVTPQTTLLWGLPRPTALLLAIVGIVPLFVLPVVYAMTFDGHVLSKESLAEVVAASQAAQHKAAQR